MKSNSRASLTPRQARIVREIQRIAGELDAKSLSQRQFNERHRLGGVSTAGYQFGSWNDAVRAAGLEPIPSGRSNPKRKLTDAELLREILKVHRDIGGPPSERRMAAIGRYSVKPYKERWRSFAKAKRAAYQDAGWPD